MHSGSRQSGRGKYLQGELSNWRLFFFFFSFSNFFITFKSNANLLVWFSELSSPQWHAHSLGCTNVWPPEFCAMAHAPEKALWLNGCIYLVKYNCSGFQHFPDCSIQNFKVLTDCRALQGDYRRSAVRRQTSFSAITITKNSDTFSHDKLFSHAVVPGANVHTGGQA